MTPFTERLIKKALKENDGIGMFQESVWEFHTGAAFICLRLKVPYIPVAIVGNRSLFKGKFKFD